MLKVKIFIFIKAHKSLLKLVGLRLDLWFDINVKLRGGIAVLFYFLFTFTSLVTRDHLRVDVYLNRSIVK